MTNGWIDIKNTDMMLVMGGNPAENHPCGFKWAIEAKRNRNAKLIVVDPRFNRTAAVADKFAQIRAGSDIAFLGGMIKYAIENNRIAKDYIINYTNATFIVKDGFKLPEDGFFSGFDAATQAYDKATWNYEEGGNLTNSSKQTTETAATPSATASTSQPQSQVAESKQASEGGGQGPPGGGHQAAGAPGAAAQSAPKPPPTMPPNTAYDLSLQHPRCVFQLLKKHYSRYTPEVVEKITGIPANKFLEIADM